MEYLLSGAELDELGERMVRDYLNGREAKSVDIEDFVSSYLGLTIRYETIAETDEGKIGFISDGRTPLWVNRPEGAVQEIFDENTIVVDKYLLNDYEMSRKRFTIAHEVAHYLLGKFNPAETMAEFCWEYDSDRTYAMEDLSERLNLTEWQANNLAAAILMPRFLLEKALEKWNDGRPIPVCGRSVLPFDSRMKVRGMAERLGVSHTALMIQLRKYKLVEQRDLGEFIRSCVKVGGV